MRIVCGTRKITGSIFPSAYTYVTTGIEYICIYVYRWIRESRTLTRFSRMSSSLEDGQESTLIASRARITAMLVVIEAAIIGVWPLFSRFGPPFGDRTGGETSDHVFDHRPDLTSSCYTVFYPSVTIDRKVATGRNLKMETRRVFNGATTERSRLEKTKKRGIVGTHVDVAY